MAWRGEPILCSGSRDKASSNRCDVIWRGEPVIRSGSREEVSREKWRCHVERLTN